MVINGLPTFRVDVFMRPPDERPVKAGIAACENAAASLTGHSVTGLGVRVGPSTRARPVSTAAILALSGFPVK